MPDNRKYAPTLMKKVEEIRKENEKQQALHEKYKIEGDVKIKEESFAAGFLHLLRTIAFIIIAVLAFIFVLIMLYPDSRNVFINAFKEGLPLSAVYIGAIPFLFVIVTIITSVISNNKAKKGTKA